MRYKIYSGENNFIIKQNNESYYPANEIPNIIVSNLNWTNGEFITGKIDLPKKYLDNIEDYRIGIKYYSGRYVRSYKNRNRWKLREGCYSLINTDGSFSIPIPSLPNNLEDLENPYLKVKLVLFYYTIHNEFEELSEEIDLQKQYIYYF